MWQNNFQYYAELESLGGEHLGDVPLDVDWIPALRWVEFEQTLQNQSAEAGVAADTLIEPRWMTDGEPPYVRGVQLCQGGNGAAPLELPISYFFDAVTAASAKLVAAGALETGEQFEYKIYALSLESARNQTSATIDVVPVDQTPDFDRVHIAPVVANARLHSAAPTSGRRSTDEAIETMPVFIPDRVLAEATTISRSAEDTETGGILVGKLCRDPGGDVFATVTAQIPAEHATGTHASLRLTPETWVSVDAAIRLRNRDEIALGWWHCHPFFCRRCTPAMRALCPFSTPAFSAADRDVHREVFQQPWSIALLLSFLGEPLPSYDLFAWQRGQIKAVDFYTLPDHDNQN